MVKNNIKILHIIDSGGLYGAEIMLLHLAAEQIKQGHQPVIASIGEKHISEKPLEKEARKRGIAVQKFRMTPGPNPFGAMQLLQFARNEKFDLLHSHGYKGNILLGFIPRKIRRLPLLTTVHGWTSVAGLTKMRVYEALDAVALRLVDGVVLVNGAMLANPKIKGVQKRKLHVIPNGIPNSFSPEHGVSNDNLDPSIVSFCKSKTTIGSIGRLSTEKGYRYLIQALAALVAEGVDCQLVIIGEGYERPRLERLISDLKLHGRVLMPGYREQAGQYIPHFSVFVMSSLTEGLPITLLEAMQSKVPVLATNVGGIPEVLENGRAGLLVQPRDVNGLATAMKQMNDAPALAEHLVSNAYERISTEYHSINMAEQYLQMYSQLVDKALNFNYGDTEKNKYSPCREMECSFMTHSKTGSSSTVWNELATTYDEQRQSDTVYMSCVQQVADEFPHWSNNCLDAGCGTGISTVEIAKGAKRIFAVDYSYESLRTLKSKNISNIFPIQADITALPFKKSIFEASACANTLQHFRPGSPQEKAIAELRRVTKGGCNIVVSVHHYSKDKQNAGWIKEGKPGQLGVDYIFRFAREDLSGLMPRAIIKAAGFYELFNIPFFGASLQKLAYALFGGIASHMGRGHMLIGVEKNG